MGVTGTVSGRIRTAAISCAAAGFLVVLAGFAYDVIFAGIPYQDPPAALSESYARHSSVASGIRIAGAGVCLAGILAWITVLIAGRKTSGVR